MNIRMVHKMMVWCGGLIWPFLMVTCAFTFSAHGLESGEIGLKIKQVTSGEKHHYFGYIGQSRTIPWNASERYILGLEIDFIDRMPEPQETANIIVVDASDNNRLIQVEKTHAWNPQQGTMFFWNPKNPESQFFFNDRDLTSGKVFTVLYDIESRKRMREYQFDHISIGNGGVALNGEYFLGLNYGRLARLRQVTGYPQALDWSSSELAPENDGVFRVDIESGEARLLVSYRQMENLLTKALGDLDHTGLFVNHTLWNRDSDRIYFFARAGWSGSGGKKINSPFSVRVDGSDLKLHTTHIGGHPEWAEGSHIIGRSGKNQVIYDVEQSQIVGMLGTPSIFPDPEGDIALSPNGRLFVNGFKMGNQNFYSVYRRSDGAHVRSDGLDKGGFGGDIRIDPAPRWNRQGNKILVPGIAPNGTRQMFCIEVSEKNEVASDFFIEHVMIEPATKSVPRSDTAAAIELPDGRLMVVYHKYESGKASGHDHGICRIWSKESHDGGSTWVNPRMLVDVAEGDMNVQAPALIRLKNGVVLMAYLRAHKGGSSSSMVISQSDDNGKSFKEISKVWSKTKGQLLQGGVSSIIELHSGRLILPFHGGTGNQWSQKNSAGCFFSDDKGKTWTRSAQISLPKRGAMEASIVELDRDGHLIMSLRTQLGGPYIAESHDAGQTWGNARFSGLEGGESGTCLRRHPDTGHLILFWNNSKFLSNHHHFGERTPLSVAISKDNGKSWTRIGNLFNDPKAEYTNLDCLFTSDGTALFTYMYAKPAWNRSAISLKAAIIPNNWFLHSHITP